MWPLSVYILAKESARPAEVPEAGSPPLSQMAMPNGKSQCFSGISPWKKAIHLGVTAGKSHVFPQTQSQKVFIDQKAVKLCSLPSWLRPEGQGTSLRWTTCEGKEMHILRIHQRPVEPFRMQYTCWILLIGLLWTKPLFHHISSNSARSQGCGGMRHWEYALECVICNRPDLRWDLGTFWDLDL
jgi:hypothetical protein